MAEEEEKLKYKIHKPHNQGVVEDRRTAQRMTIREILITMQREADECHAGMLSDSALTIFNTLNAGDKRTFLRYAIMVIYADLVERSKINNTQEITIDNNLKISFEEVTEEQQCFVDFNKAEQIKFVNFLTRVFFVVLIILFSIFICFVIFYGNDDVIGTLLKRLSEALEMLLKF